MPQRNRPWFRRVCLGASGAKAIEPPGRKVRTFRYKGSGDGSGESAKMSPKQQRSNYARDGSNSRKEQPPADDDGKAEQEEEMDPTLVALGVVTTALGVGKILLLGVAP